MVLPDPTELHGPPGPDSLGVLPDPTDFDEEEMYEHILDEDFLDDEDPPPCESPGCSNEAMAGENYCELCLEDEEL